MKAINSLAAALLLLTATTRCVAADGVPRPNVLFLMSDDHVSNPEWNGCETGSENE